MGPKPRNRRSLFAVPLRIGAALREPERFPGGSVPGQHISDVAHHDRVIRHRPVGVKAQDVEITRRVVVEKGLVIRNQRMQAETALHDFDRRSSGLEPEISRLLGGREIPGRFGGETAVRLVPELPGADFSLELPGQRLGEAVERQKVVRQFPRNRPRPRRRIVERACDADSAFRQKLRVDRIFAPCVLAGTRFALSPRDPFADAAETTEPAKLAHRLICVARKQRAGIIGRGQPALRAVHRKEALRIPPV